MSDLTAGKSEISLLDVITYLVCHHQGVTLETDEIAVILTFLWQLGRGAVLQTKNCSNPATLETITVDVEKVQAELDRLQRENISIASQP